MALDLTRSISLVIYDHNSQIVIAARDYVIVHDYRRTYSSSLFISEGKIECHSNTASDSCQIVTRFWTKGDLNINNRQESMTLWATMTQSGRCCCRLGYRNRVLMKCKKMKKVNYYGIQKYEILITNEMSETL